MKGRLTPPRIDAFVVWPHGLEYKKSILRQIVDAKFDIVRIERIHKLKVPSLIDFLYKSDKVPFYHIRSKKKFIKENIGDAICIFVRNSYPNLIASGEGLFRHAECLEVKSLKNSIRAQFNPRKNGVPTENHVIHATDSVSDSKHLTKFFDIDYENLMEVSEIGMPYHIEGVHSYTVEEMDLEKLTCGIASGDRWVFDIKIRPIIESPHYKFLQGNENVYSNYIEKYFGTALKDDYSTEKFQNLKLNFDPYSSGNFIVVKKYKSHMYVLDGLHRASILLHRQIKKQYCICLS